ncbi:MAG: hypothetical protein RLY58_1269 [Pseudomonadota bacterium]|jgi:hypothetical protein
MRLHGTPPVLVWSIFDGSNHGLVCDLIHQKISRKSFLWHKKAPNEWGRLGWLHIKKVRVVAHQRSRFVACCF